jgi:acyl CoA:acetate/3-ketoacid CoA transferase beta subunit
MDISPDEIMVVAMARQILDDEVVVQGLATPVVAAAYLLARHTHAPNLSFASAIGQSLCRRPAPLGLIHVESLWLDQGLYHAGFVRAVADVLPRLKPKEFFRPAQVDPYGNFNNIAFGKDYRRPRFRLPGTGGIPDVTIFFHNILLYVPRHSRLTFVSKLDFRAGLGYDPARTHGSGPQYLVSDLGQFGFEGTQADGDSRRRMRLLSFHPGVSIETIRSRTGFPLVISPDTTQTPLPTPAELNLLRDVIDPLGIRKLEFLSGAERRELLHRIIRFEMATVGPPA